MNTLQLLVDNLTLEKEKFISKLFDNSEEIIENLYPISSQSRSESMLPIMKLAETYRSERFFSDLALIIAIEFEFRLKYDNKYYNSKEKITNDTIEYFMVIRKLKYVAAIKSFLIRYKFLPERRIDYLISVYHDAIKDLYNNSNYQIIKFNNLIISLRLYNLFAKIEDCNLVIRVNKNKNDEYL